MPNEMLSGILGYLDFSQLQSIRLVCRQIAAFVDVEWTNTVVSSGFDLSTKGLAKLHALVKLPSLAQLLSSLRILIQYPLVKPEFHDLLCYQQPEFDCWRILHELMIKEESQFLGKGEATQQLTSILRYLPNLQALDIIGRGFPDPHRYLSGYTRPFRPYQLQWIFRAIRRSGIQLRTINLEYSHPSSDKFNRGLDLGTLSNLAKANSPLHLLKNLRLVLHAYGDTVPISKIIADTKNILAGLLSIERLDIGFTSQIASLCFLQQLTISRLWHLRALTLTDTRVLGLDCATLLRIQRSVIEMSLIRCCFNSIPDIQETLNEFKTYTRLRRLSLRMIQTPSEIIRYTSLPEQPAYPFYFTGYNKGEECVVFDTRASIDKFLPLVIATIGP